MYRYLFALLISSSVLLIPSLSFAQTPTCTIIYGGGEIECDATVSATAKPTTTPTTRNQQPATDSAGTTKGGVSVQKPTNPKETPATGPEMLSLAAFIPVAGLGYYLRRKTQ